MPTIAYKTTNFRQQTLEIIDTANNIIEEYQAEGYDLTLRQLYYQFVARDIIPNSDKEYGKLGNVINNARLSGLLDWDAIIDRTRSVKNDWHWDSPEEIIENSADTYHIDTRATQEHYLEVWVEKDALVGVLEKVCRRLGVPYLSCRGYVSQSAMWRAARRLVEKEQEQETIILHLGDHDPSGIDMTRDIQERLEMFQSNVDVKRIALNMNQVEQYNPPPNPAKVTDSRFQGYMAEYGEESWELDALDPRTITKLIEKAVNGYTDKGQRQVLIDRQEEDRDKLRQLAENWQT